MKKISDGPHGATYKAKWRGTVVAVKVLKDSEKINLGSLTQELNVIFKVQHPNIVQLLGAVVNVRVSSRLFSF